MKPSRYYELMSDRPEKATPEEVEYREAEDVKERCASCLHFYQRKIDDYGVCELMRPKDDESVDENYVCEWWTPDGVDFPLYVPKR